MMTGEKYDGRDIAEVVPVGPRAAYVRIHLDFYNAHVCAISGVALAEGDSLVLRRHDAVAQCTLTIARSGKGLRIDDGDYSCKAYCGARGSLTDNRLPYASKRSIRYLPRLKQSREYREALAEWRTGKPAN